MDSLAIKYRPHKWEDVVEQNSTKVILQRQLDNNEIKHSYLFVGGAGTGKTTCARIFANEVNKGQGSPIELDGASNNSIDDVREIIAQAQTKSLTSEYKVFIIDECHALSNSAWQGMLKLIEEPPAKTLFIFCTTDPQKIPKTILSRVQRYDFQMISQDGIVLRLMHILTYEGLEARYKPDALEYIAKLANGHLRNALTMLDKCLAYNHDLTIENVVKALGTVDYDVMSELLSALSDNNVENVIELIEKINGNGDIKLFIKSFTEFIFDVYVYSLTKRDDLIQTPLYVIKECNNTMQVHKLLSNLIKLQADIKYDNNPKYLISYTLMEVMK